MTAKNIYIRFSNGIGHSLLYETNKTVQQYFKQCTFLGEDYSQQEKAAKNNDEIVVVCNGRKLQVKQTLGENKLTQESILHVLQPKNRNSLNLCSDNSIKINFDGEYFELQLDRRQKVIDLKKWLQKQADVPWSQQLILFQSIKLQNGKTLQQYDIKCGDLLSMSVLESMKPIVIDNPVTIYPKKQKKGRRHSFGGDILNQQQASTSNQAQSIYSKLNKKMSLTNKLSETQILGPSPLSGTSDTQQKSYFNKFESQKWIGFPHLNQIAQEEQEFSSAHYDPPLFAFDSNQQQIVLCESYNYQQLNDQKPIQKLQSSGEDVRKINLIKMDTDQRFLVKFDKKKIQSTYELQLLITQLQGGFITNIHKQKSTSDSGNLQNSEEQWHKQDRPERKLILHQIKQQQFQEISLEEVLYRLKQNLLTTVFFEWESIQPSQ